MTPTPELREEVARAIMKVENYPDGRAWALWLPQADAAIAATLAWVEREKK